MANSLKDDKSHISVCEATVFNAQPTWCIYRSLVYLSLKFDSRESWFNKFHRWRLNSCIGDRHFHINLLNCSTSLKLRRLIFFSQYLLLLLRFYAASLTSPPRKCWFWETSIGGVRRMQLNWFWTKLIQKWKIIELGNTGGWVNQWGCGRFNSLITLPLRYTLLSKIISLQLLRKYYDFHLDITSGVTNL